MNSKIYEKLDEIKLLIEEAGDIPSATAENQTTLQGAQGTGASYDPPTGGSGVFGWLSGIFKEIVSGVKLKLGGSDVSSSNPLPTITVTKFSGALQISEGRNWECPLISKVGESAKYSAFCLFNPTASDVRMMLVALSAWVGSSTQIRQIKTIINPATLPAIWTEQSGVFANTLVKVSDSRVCPFKVYTAALTVLDPATWFNINNTSTTPTGSNNRGESKFFEVGTGIIFVCVTANITLNAYAELAEE